MTTHINPGTDRLVSAGLALLDADPDRNPAASGVNPIFEGAPLGFHPLGYTRLDDAMPELVDEGYTRNPDDEQDEDDTPFEGMGVSPLALAVSLGQALPPAAAPATNSRPAVDPAKLAQAIVLNAPSRLVTDLGLPPSLPTATNAEDLPEDVEIGTASGRDLPLLPHWRTRASDLKRAGIPQVARAEVNQCINLILTNLTMAADADPQVWTSISRSEEWWGKRQGVWPEWATYTFMKAAMDFLADPLQGWAEEQKAEQGKAQHIEWEDEHGEKLKGLQSRYRATRKLVEAMRSVGRFVHEIGDNVIRCRRRTGTPVPVRLTDRVERLAAPIVALNGFLSKVEVELVTQDPTCTLSRSRITIDRVNRKGRRTKQFLCPSPRVVLFRSYCRGVLTKGGRVYWWGQALPEDLRGQLRINGEAVVELDYKAIHPRLLYAELGLPMDFDPYVVEGFPQIVRDEWKLALLVAVNAPGGRKGIVNALLKKAASGDWPHDEVTTYRAIEALAKRNLPIAAQFGRDRGVDLMRVDSDMIVRVMVRCRKLGIVALPVHDSVIVAVSHADTVEAIMHEEFRRASGGFEVVVDRKIGRLIITGNIPYSSRTSLENPLQALPPSSPSPSSLSTSPNLFPAALEPLGPDSLQLSETLYPLGSDNLEGLASAKLPEALEPVLETSSVEEQGQSQVSLSEASHGLHQAMPPRPINPHSFALLAKAKARDAAVSTKASTIADLKAGNRPCEAPSVTVRPGHRPEPRKALRGASPAVETPASMIDDLDLALQEGYRYVPEAPEPKATPSPELQRILDAAKAFNDAGRTSVTPRYPKLSKAERNRRFWA